MSEPRARTLRDLAADATAPNAAHAAARIRDDVAKLEIYALQAEAALRQAGIAVPPPAAYSRAAAIRARLATPAAAAATTSTTAYSSAPPPGPPF
jgi:hypothetical protein